MYKKIVDTNSKVIEYELQKSLMRDELDNKYKEYETLSENIKKFQ